ncbi:hypothetical protein DFP72DRAFT_843239 [Ephemerocybe angulata]|uniref:Uncharacterized protein n=1 Tax=Ephemerocybe angulata TaxID=980116 RepID=A0A8H6MDD6_9AGAR|nr:hypothetical protein DFP72DRAFT_843239 [Tulosesus angulatus]
MRVTFRPLIALLLGAGSLVLSSHNGVAELDNIHARHSRLSERSFGDGYDGLNARETVDVPFQPSLRAFLEDAATVHRRAVQEYDDLEARTRFVLTINLGPDDPPTRTHSMMVTTGTTLFEVQRAVSPLLRGPPDNIDLWGPEGFLGRGAARTLGQAGINENNALIAATFDLPETLVSPPPTPTKLPNQPRGKRPRKLPKRTPAGKGQRRR